MKKILFVSIISIAILATGCKKDKSKSLEYNDSNPINMVLRGEHQINASSEYDITYQSLNETAVTVTSTGKLYGKNVGEAQVKLDNGYESKTIDVKVDLFTEPTFEFGCSPSRIRTLYGTPNAGYVDTILVYQYTADGGYSWACGEMDFFFYDGQYFESTVYLRPNVEGLLNNYLNENFNHIRDIHDSIVSPYTHIDTIITISIYRNKIDEDIVCRKAPSLNKWHELLLLYYSNPPQNLCDNSLKTLPLSSKLRY